MTEPVKTTDGSLTLFSDRYQETYHSIHGAETESRHIFLEASGVADRLRANQPTRVLEIGFGLGLNCLLTADLAAECQTSLAFTSVEKHLLNPEKLKELSYHRVVKTPILVERLQMALDSRQAKLTSATAPAPAPAYGTASAHASESLNISLASNIELKLLLGDACDIQYPPGHYNAVYLDAFSPDTNPECWSLSFLEILHRSLKKDGNLTTYSAKGDVRRNLQKAGFQVHKHPGPPGKREFLVASV